MKKGEERKGEERYTWYPCTVLARSLAALKIDDTYFVENSSHGDVINVSMSRNSS